MPKPCPESVVNAGAMLVAIRQAAKNLSDLVDKAMPDIHAAIDEVVEKHGAKAMQAGTAIANLRTVQATEGLTGEAHNVLRLVLRECDIEEPTNAQIVAKLGRASIR